MNEYKLLDPTKNEDIEKIREYAKARTEANLLRRRLDFLQTLFEDNDDISESVWTTQDGETKAITDLTDSHLKNIIIHLAKQDGYNRRIVQEHQIRFGDAPLMLD